LEKQKYYVSVHEKSVLRDQGAAPYEWEIEATEEEAERLQFYLDALEDADRLTFFRGITPGIPYHMDAENDVYDENLKQVYELIRDLGTAETRSGASAVLERLTGIGHSQG